MSLYDREVSNQVAQISGQDLHQRSVIGLEDYLTYPVGLRRAVQATTNSPESTAEVAFREERSKGTSHRNMLVPIPWDIFGVGASFGEQIAQFKVGFADGLSVDGSQFIKLYNRNQAGALQTRLDVTLQATGLEGPEDITTSYFIQPVDGGNLQVVGMVTYYPDQTASSLTLISFMPIDSCNGERVSVPDRCFTASLDMSGDLMTGRVQSFLNNRVNCEYSESSFTYLALKLPEGARFEDRLRGETLVVKSGQLVQLGDPLPPLPLFSAVQSTRLDEGPSTSRWRFWLTGINVVILVCVGGVFVYLRVKK